MFLFEVLDCLEKEKVDYALVGGYALALHGLVRATMDVDFVIRLNKSQAKSVERALKSINLTSRLPLKAEEVIEFRQDYIKKRNLIAWSFVDYNDPSRIVDLILTESTKTLKVQKISVSGRKVPVASLKDLLRMKTNTGRAKDALDVENIRKKLNEKTN